MLQAEINIFVKDGAGHVKVLLPAEVAQYDAEGAVVAYDAPDAAKIVAAVSGVWQALEAAGFTPSPMKRGGGGGNPNWKKPQATEIKTTDGANIEVKCPKCGGKVWDNRDNKASGKFSPKAPDFKCRDKACDTPLWSWVEYVAQQQLKQQLDAPRDGATVDPSDLPFE